MGGGWWVGEGFRVSGFGLEGLSLGFRSLGLWVLEN